MSSVARDSEWGHTGCLLWFQKRFFLYSICEGKTTARVWLIAHFDYSNITVKLCLNFDFDSDLESYLFQ